MPIANKDQVIESWGILIEKAQGKAEEVFQSTEDFIKESKAPSLRTKREKMSPSIVGSILGSKRDFLTPGAERAEREVPTPSGWG